MRAVTYFIHNGYAFDILTQAYDIDNKEWGIKVTYTWTDSFNSSRHINGSGKASEYEQAGRAAVLDCIESSKKQTLLARTVRRSSTWV